jgi:hypothetical protein
VIVGDADDDVGICRAQGCAHATVARQQLVLLVLRGLVQPAGGARRMGKRDDRNNLGHAQDRPFSIFSA